MPSKSLLLASVTCVVGLIFAHHPMLMTGFDGIQISHEDPRLINFLLEHSFQWLVGNSLHRDLWSPPFFFPATGTLALSDSLLSAGPLYWPLRLAGIPADTAFQIWLMICFALNDLIFLVFLRRSFALKPWPSAMGAFLFAFAGSRVVDVGHPQLLPHFFTILAALAVSEVMRRGSALSLAARLFFWIVAGLSAAAQLYASFYMGWFLVFGAILMIGWGLLMQATRLTLIERFRRDGLLILAAGFIAFVPTWILYIHYIEVAKTTGFRSFQEVVLAVPRLISWIYMGPHSWLYHRLTRLQTFMDFGSLEAAHRIGIGWITPVVCFAGLISGWNRPTVRLLAITGFTLFVMVTRLPRWSIEGLALSTWMACPLAFLEEGNRPREKAFAVFLYGSLLWLLCPLMALLPVVLLLVLWSLFARKLTPEQRLRYETPTAIGICLFPAIPSFIDTPLALLSGGLGAVANLLIHRRSRQRLVAWSPIVLIPAILAFLLLPNMSSELNLWKFVYAYVPGGAAIRVSSRVCLLLLIPMAVGFAFFWEKQSITASPLLMLPLALFCMMEQGMTTTSYSKREARKRVNTIASSLREIRGPQTFFFSSARPGLPNWNDHVDAMWAGLESGLPSINGYSGHSPQGWYSLYDAAVRSEGEEVKVRKDLEEWIRLKAMDPKTVVWVLPGLGRSALRVQWMAQQPDGTNRPGK